MGGRGGGFLYLIKSHPLTRMTYVFVLCISALGTATGLPGMTSRFIQVHMPAPYVLLAHPQTFFHTITSEKLIFLKSLTGLIFLTFRLPD